MLRRHPSLFIFDYCETSGVTVVEHQINLKPNQKSMAQKRGLGKIQQEALSAEVKKLTQAGFIYPVEDPKWVSPMVVTLKKSGKWRVSVDYTDHSKAYLKDPFPSSLHRCQGKRHGGP